VRGCWESARISPARNRRRRNVEVFCQVGHANPGGVHYQAEHRGPSGNSPLATRRNASGFRVARHALCPLSVCARAQYLISRREVVLKTRYVCAGFNRVNGNLLLDRHAAHATEWVDGALMRRARRTARRIDRLRKYACSRVTGSLGGKFQVSSASPLKPFSFGNDGTDCAVA